MASDSALQDLRRALGQRDSLWDQPQRRALSLRTAITAFVLAPWQIVTPVGIAVAPNLGVDETVDGFGAKHRPASFPPQATGDLFRRVTLRQTLEHHLAQLRLARQSRATPTPGPGLICGPTRLVTEPGAAVALQLPADGRCRAIQSCSDLPARLPRLPEAGQSCNVRPVTAVRSFPWQHDLISLLHFVCELTRISPVQPPPRSIAARNIPLSDLTFSATLSAWRKSFVLVMVVSDNL